MFFLGRPFLVYKVMVIPDAAHSAEIDKCFRQCNLISENNSRTSHRVTSCKTVDIIVTCEYVSLNWTAFFFMFLSLCPCVRNYEEYHEISCSVSTIKAVDFFVKITILLLNLHFQIF